MPPPKAAKSSKQFEWFDGSARVRYSGHARWSSLVARRAHNPKVVSSNLTRATNLSDSQGLVGCFQRALLLFGKDLGKKSVFPYQSQAIQSRTIRQVSRPRSVHHRRKYGCNRPSHHFRCGPDAACESAAGCQENPLLWPPCDGNCAVLETPHVSRSALPVQWFSPSRQTSLVAWYQSSECRDGRAPC